MTQMRRWAHETLEPVAQGEAAGESLSLRRLSQGQPCRLYQYFALSLCLSAGDQSVMLSAWFWWSASVLTAFTCLWLESDFGYRRDVKDGLIDP